MEKKTHDEEMEVPEGIAVALEGTTLTISGQKGKVIKRLESPIVTITIRDGKILFVAKRASKKTKSIINTYKAHIRNAFKGCQDPFVFKMKICSGHFPMNVVVSGKQLLIKNFLGEKVPRKVTLKEGVSVKIEGQEITIEGVDKERAGQVAADIEQATRRPGFDTRIFQDGIYITDKAGKEI